LAGRKENKLYLAISNSIFCNIYGGQIFYNYKFIMQFSNYVLILLGKEREGDLGRRDKLKFLCLFMSH
jgi:hypothetical protein